MVQDEAGGALDLPAIRSKSQPALDGIRRCEPGDKLRRIYQEF